MARRMFSPQIVGSDAFLDMPTSSRELYFQFGMFADDDGFVNPRRVMRMIGASEDDLRMLIGKRFVLPFENGVIVIKHWRVNNLVRKDWYRPTSYTEQKKLLFLKQTGAYTDNPSHGLPLVNELVNVGKVRLGKVINTSTPASQGLSAKEEKMKTYNEREHSDSDMPTISDGEYLNQKKPEIEKDYQHLFDYAYNQTGKKIIHLLKNRKALKEMRLADISMQEIKDKYSDMLKIEFWSKRGFDFADVWSQMKTK